MANKAKTIRRQNRVRFHLKSIGSRPRLSVTRSNAHISASIIDDGKHITIASVSDKDLKGSKTERATLVGENIAKLSIKAGVTQVAYDRGSYRYHGRVKSLAEGARKAGLDF